jgi:HEAT repeat protein
VGRVGRVGWLSKVERVGWKVLALFLLLLPNPTNLPDPRDPPVLFATAQPSFEGTTRDLVSKDASTRLRAVQRLQEAALVEAALPLAPLVNDPQDEVQLAAIAAELNIFLAEPVVPRKRVGFVVEKRVAIVAEAAFSSGPFALGPRPVPPAVVDAVRKAVHDDNPRVALEAVYAFGVLATPLSGAARRDLLRASGPEVAPLLGSSEPGLRYAAARVLGRVFEPRAQDEPIDESVGDALITTLNDDDRAVKAAAMQALGALRYERGVQALTDLYTFYGANEAAAAALDALAHIAHPSTAAVLTAALSAKNPALRTIAIEGLARLGDASRLPAIQAAVEADRNDTVALAGAYASARLANQPIVRIADALSRDRLRAQARGYLIDLLPGRVASITSHLQDPDARIRLEIVELLGVSGDPAALPLVETALKDKDQQVARAAERAVARLRRQ